MIRNKPPLMLNNFREKVAMKVHEHKSTTTGAGRGGQSSEARTTAFGSAPASGPVSGDRVSLLYTSCRHSDTSHRIGYSHLNGNTEIETLDTRSTYKSCPWASNVVENWPARHGRIHCSPKNLLIFTYFIFDTIHPKSFCK